MNKLTKLFAIVLSSFLFLSGCGSGTSAGEGKKIGQIVKIGKHGIVCSTFEAEIIRGGFNGGSGVNGQALDFTIKSPKLYKELTLAMENQQEIELHFMRRAFTGICYSETGIVATGFRVLDNHSDNKEDSGKESQPEWKAKEKMSKETSQVSFDEEDTLVVNP